MTETQIEVAVRQLGHQDFHVREQATRTLWAAGTAAEPALRRALDDGNPEVGRRARTILSNLAYGITPDMSADIIELMSRYRKGDAAFKRQAAGTLAQRGAVGARVLLKLREEEPDQAIRSVISPILLRSSRELAVSLIGDGDVPTARKLLAIAAHTGDEGAAMNYAAFLLLSGGLKETITALQTRVEPDSKSGAGAAKQDAQNTEILLTFLHRANGDLQAALAAAQRSESEPLIRNILIEIGDWKQLASRAAGGVEQADVEELCFATAFHRLAGDEAGVDKFAALLRVAADRQPQNSWNAAEGLLLNGRVDLGIEVLVQHNHLAAAIDFQSQRLAFGDVSKLMQRARARGDAGNGEVEVMGARTSWFTGDVQLATVALENAAKDCEKRRDLSGLIAAVEAATEMRLTDRGRWYTIAAMQVAQRMPQAAIADEARPSVTELFEKARFRDATRAAAWWRVLRQRFPRDPAGRILDTLRAIDERRMKKEDLLALCNASAIDAQRRPPEIRAAQLELIADTLAAAGQRESAIERYTQLAEITGAASSNRAATALSKLAGFDVEAGQWQGAADRYWQVWSRDHANPVPLYLSGWALMKAGDASTGKQRMERAHLIPLSDQNRRHELHEALVGRKLIDEAKREGELILRTAEFLSWRRSEALRRSGDEAHAAGDAAKAADFWERAFLDNNSTATKFVEPWANVSMPALIRRTRAIGLIRAGNVSAGLIEADASLAMAPSDADSLIEIVKTLDTTGHKKEADGLYRGVIARYEKLCETYPQSGALHNLCAWAAAKCHRDLDSALVHAKRAVELQPTSTASLDTLAETHFQRGDVLEAIAAIQKCAELEPNDPRHKEQIERFRKAPSTNSSAPRG